MHDPDQARITVTTNRFEGHLVSRTGGLPTSGKIVSWPSPFKSLYH
jgi:hypothetical protein